MSIVFTSFKHPKLPTANYLLCIFFSPLDKTVKLKIIFLFLNQNICCGYSKEPSQSGDSFDHKKQLLKMLRKEILTILRSIFLLILTYYKDEMGLVTTKPVFRGFQQTETQTSLLRYRD